MRVLVAFLAILICHASAGAAPRKASVKGSTTAAHRIPSTGTLNKTDIIAIAQMKAGASQDQFSDDPTLAYVGRDFTVTVEPPDLIVSYDRDKHVLAISFPEYLNELILARDVKQSAYLGQNAFGAKATVAKERGNSFGIRIPGNSFTRRISKAIALDGNAARDLSKAIRLRLWGKVTRANYVNTAVTVEPYLSQATVARPIDRWIDQYLVCVSLSKAEWIDSRSGAILGASALSIPVGFRPICS